MQIRLSHRSIQDYNEIITYLKENFTDKEVQGFNQILKKAKEKLLKYPESGNLYIDNIRYLKLISSVYLYYRVSEEFIDIATLYNEKRDPKVLIKILEL